MSRLISGLAALLLQQGTREPLCYEFAGLVLARLGRENDALQAFLKARRAGRNPKDRFRAFLEAVGELRKHGRAPEAARLIRREGGEFQDEVSRHLLDAYAP